MFKFPEKARLKFELYYYSFIHYLVNIYTFYLRRHIMFLFLLQYNLIGLASEYIPT